MFGRPVNRCTDHRRKLTSGATFVSIDLATSTDSSPRVALPHVKINLLIAVRQSCMKALLRRTKVCVSLVVLEKGTASAFHVLYAEVPYEYFPSLQVAPLYPACRR
ncbi:hypothetical protein RvY_15457-1 [Ramazzottius varieornatus]|uniref:Uncharacterized protein n=1 Tax=Ramazzottius varieornatus TaxID=947166 RepID=A0A1D1VUZ0_RAMVA|nr:hypothetical protein RvY_15457-1 [Ramazzottius varieornatus]